MSNTVFKPMRSSKLEGQTLTWPKLASFKLDGIRVCKYQGKTRTKSGKVLPNNFAREWIEEFVPEGFDMEIGVGDPRDPTFYAQTYSAVMRHAGESGFKLYVFDNCADLTSYTHQRLEAIKSAFALCSEAARERLVIVPQTLIHSQEEFDSFYAYALELGYEGVILRNPAGLYKYGKCTPLSQDQLKFKPEDDYDAEILEAYEGMTNTNEQYTNEVGESKRSTHAENQVPNGRLGGFLCRADEKVNTFKIGPGKLTHDELKALWEAYVRDPAALKGKFLKYRCLDYGKMANDRPRHGRWIGWRSPIDMEAVIK